MKFLQRREAKVVALLSLAALGFTAPKLAVRQRDVDPAQSTVIVHTGKTGFIKALGHDHWFTAHISKGSITEGADAHVMFTVEARDLVMVPDTRINAKDSAKIMDTTLNKVLEVDKYPEITFESSSVKPLGANVWMVTGDLHLHGATRLASARVQRDGDYYSGTATIKQTDFGMKPETAAGGMVKVKNEVEVSFKVHVS